MLLGRELAALDGAEVALDRVGHLAADVAERLRERGGVLSEADDLVDDQHLAVAVRAGADADGRDVDGVRDRLAEVRRDVFEDDGEGAGVLVLFDEVDDSAAGRGVSAMSKRLPLGDRY